MTETTARRAHLIAGGFPPGSQAGHDHDYARLRLLSLLAEGDVAASVANDFADVERWLPVSRLLITYVAGPYPDAAQCKVIQGWLEAGGHWLGLHGISGGRAERVEGARQRRAVMAAEGRDPAFGILAQFNDGIAVAGGELTERLGAPEAFQRRQRRAQPRDQFGGDLPCFQSRKDLGEEFKRKVLCDNPVRFYRFSEKDIAAAKKAR